MPKKYWKQLSIRVPGPLADAAGELLEALGAVAVTHCPVDGEDHFDLALPQMKSWSITKVSALFGDEIEPRGVIDEIIAVLHVQRSDCVVEKFEDRDWERVWLEQFKPIEIARDLWICPTWCDAPDPEAVNLRLDPGLAFGTGSHATTRLCLERLAHENLSGKTILDFGCGSGILAIAALLLGARRAFAWDIDPRALDATFGNARLNQVADRLEVIDERRMIELISAQGFIADVVVANILAKALIELSDTLSDAVALGGTLLLSGILEDQESEVASAYPRMNFEATKREGWLLLSSR